MTIYEEIQILDLEFERAALEAQLEEEKEDV